MANRPRRSKASDRTAPKTIDLMAEGDTPADGAPLVAESAAGRVVRLSRSGVETVVDGLDTPQRLARLRREQEEQALGGGDEDVARGLGERPPVRDGGVS